MREAETWRHRSLLLSSGVEEAAANSTLEEADGP